MSVYIAVAKDEAYDLAHSSGPWKKHKYIRKEGNHYVYNYTNKLSGNKVKQIMTDSGNPNNSKKHHEGSGNQRDQELGRLNDHDKQGSLHGTKMDYAVNKHSEYTGNKGNNKYVHNDHEVSSNHREMSEHKVQNKKKKKYTTGQIKAKSNKKYSSHEFWNK